MPGKKPVRSAEHAPQAPPDFAPDSPCTDAFIPPGFDEASWEAYFVSLDVRQRQVIVHQNTYLAAFARKGTVRSAAEATEISTVAVDYWLNNHLHFFNERYVQAHYAYRDSLQDKALARIEDPKGNRGSDVLLMFMLNAEWPEKYRRDTVVIGGESARDLLVALRELGGRAREARAIEGKVVDVAGDTVLKRALGTASDDDKVPGAGEDEKKGG